MSDDAFFAAERGKKGKKQAAGVAGGKQTAGAGDKWQSGVRLVSEETVKQMLSSDPKAGTTDNCPFDCDCCF